MTASLASSSRPADAAAVAAVALAAAILFTLAWALLHVGDSEGREITDTPVYQTYGDAIVSGDVPYRDFVPEYPPLALPAFALPSLVAGRGATPDEYRSAFELLMLACGLAAVGFAAAALAALRAPLPRVGFALAVVAASPLLLGPVVLTRFDFWPAALTAAALAALLLGRDRTAAAALALAVTAKIYPVVLVPLAAAWVWRRRGPRETLVCGSVHLGVLAAAFLPFLAAGAGGVVDSLEQQLSRPLQIESLGAALLVALHHVAGVDVEVVSNFGSQNVGGVLGERAGTAATAGAALALALLWTQFARRPREQERLVSYAAAAVVAFVAFGKVLSPQFMIWLVPLVPLVRGRRGLVASGLLVAALVLTQQWFPFRYWDYARDLDGGMTALVLARDLALVALLVTLVWPARERESTAP